MSSTLLLPQRAQLCNRSCSNKTHTMHLVAVDVCFVRHELAKAYCSIHEFFLVEVGKEGECCHRWTLVAFLSRIVSHVGICNWSWS
jgi:hypothetical protein